MCNSAQMLPMFYRRVSRGSTINDIRIIKRCLGTRLINELNHRGILKHSVPESSTDLAVSLSQPQMIYAGFDPTTPSLHIGNHVVIASLIHFLRHGHEIICVVGGGSALVDDPSDTSGISNLNQDVVADYSDRIQTCLRSIFDNHEKYFWAQGSLPDPLILDNKDWLSRLSVINLFTKIGRKFKLKDLHKKSGQDDSVLNFSQFSYQIIQAVDWLHLYKSFNCKYQVGGTDQYQNIEIGSRFIREILDIDDCFGIITNLLVDKKGKKLSKSSPQTIKMAIHVPSSAFNYYQALLKTPDSQLPILFNYLTFLPVNEIKTILDKHLEDPAKFYGQEKLAEILTLLVHGESGLMRAQRATAALFKNDADSLKNMGSDELINIIGLENCYEIKFDGNISLIELIKRSKAVEVDSLQSAAIKGELLVNNKPVKSPEMMFDASHVLPNDKTVIKIGRKIVIVVKWTL